jgi:glycosyltransferase involved in cell wall biosynthesis
MARKVTFCTYDAPLFHGPNTWLKRLLPELSKNGFKIEVLVFFEHDLNKCETYKFFINSGYSVKTFPFKSIAEEKILWILRVLSFDPPDIFVPNMLVHAFFAAHWVKKAGIPTIGLIHSDEKFYEGIIDEFVNGREEYKVSAVITCSKYLLDKVAEGITQDILIRCIPYGVPIPTTPIAAFNVQKLKLIYVGRLVEKQKRITDVVKAMCKASNEIDGVEGMIYGHGEDKMVIDLIKKYSTNDKVKFCGSVPNKEVFYLFSTAQIFVLLSDYEGLSQSLLEAMACGLVPVCSNMKSGIPELITNNQTGIIVENRTSEFIKAIRRLKEEPALCMEISKNARQKVLSYSLELCASSWVNLLNELLSNRKVNAKIEVPAKIQLPKPHPYLKREDFRTSNVTEAVLSKIRKLITLILKKHR